MSIRICDSSSSKKKRAHKTRKRTRNMCLDNVFDEKFGGSSNSCCILSELSQEVVSNLSETVVALASFNGDRLHVACTGIVVKNDKFGTSVLTSAILVRSLDTDNGCKIIPTLMIEVSLPNNQSAIGWLMHYDLNYNVAVVNISHYPGFRAAHFDHHMQFGSDSKVVALGRCLKTGKLKALSGIVTDEPSGVYREHLMISTCEITVGMTGGGGARVDLDGNFVGMNFYSKRRTPFLPMDKIYNCLVHSGILWVESEHGGDSTFERSACEIQECSSPFVPYVDDSLQLDAPEFVEEELWHFLDPNPLPVDDFTELVRNDLKSCNYPMPIRLEGGMRLVNTFEEEFAEDTWSKLSKKVSSDISRSVVSLASFKGEERFFACTGIFIDFKENTSRVLTSASLVRASSDEYKIADNLKIEVYLPNKQLAVGTLQHYNLSYNVAVKGFRRLRTAKFHKEIQIEPHMEVVAVGRIFESGKLMATGGTVANKKGNLDCKELMISTCKVTKAGIGGPLIDFDGNFIGVNFYGMEETHFLPSKVLERLIRVEGSDVDDASNMKPKRYYLRNKVSNMKQNSWPVPEPRWFYPSRVSCTIETSLNASLTPEPLNFVAKDLSFVLLDSEFMISMPLPNPELVDLVSSDSLVTNVLNLNGETLPCD